MECHVRCQTCGRTYGRVCIRVLDMVKMATILLK